MAGIFVNVGDGGVGPAGASNSFTPHFTPTCDALFYPNTCTARVTGAWLNAILSEIGQAVDNAGLAIDCNRTDNLNRAIMTHGQTVGYCGASRADAETQKGGPLVPGDYWLNTSTGIVYVIDDGGADWALPNQPAAFLCCDGAQWARCGGTYVNVGGGGGVTLPIPAADVSVTACPVGPINANTDGQSAFCTLSTAIDSLSDANNITVTACPSGPINANTTVQDAICTLSASVGGAPVARLIGARSITSGFIALVQENIASFSFSVAGGGSINMTLINPIRMIAKRLQAGVSHAVGVFGGQQIFTDSAGADTTIRYDTAVLLVRGSTTAPSTPDVQIVSDTNISLQMGHIRGGITNNALDPLSIFVYGV